MTKLGKRLLIFFLPHDIFLCGEMTRPSNINLAFFPNDAHPTATLALYCPILVSSKGPSLYFGETFSIGSFTNIH